MRKYVLLLLFLLSACAARADHLKGGWIKYTYLGPGASPNTSKYYIEVKEYRKCNEQRSGIISLGIFDGSNNQYLYQVFLPSLAIVIADTLDKTSFGPCVSSPPRVCYYVDTYDGTIEFPDNAGGYILAYQRCCRIVGIKNIVHPSNDVGITFTATIPGKMNGVSVTNNTAVFEQKDTALVCAGSPFSFSFRASDPDGDSLVYAFCSGLSGGTGSLDVGPGLGTAPVQPGDPPFTPIPYASPYTGESPMGNTVTINPQTGIISGTAPTTTGEYIVAVCVSEFRNGILIITQRKEIHITVSDCVVVFAKLKASYINCSETALLFQNESTNTNTISYLWDFGIPSLLTDTSTSPTPSFDYRVSGNDSGTYQVKLKIATSTGCIDSAESKVYIYNGFKPNFSVTPLPTCSFQYQFSDKSVSRYGSMNSWKWNFGDNTTNADTAIIPNPQWQYPGTASNLAIKLIVGDSRGCVDSVSLPLTIQDKPVTVLKPSYTTCNGTTLIFRNEIEDPNIASYHWDFGLTGSTTDTSSLPRPSFDFIASGKDSGTYSVTLWATSANGCIDSATTIAYVFPGFRPAFTLDTISCLPNTILFRDASVTKYGTLNYWKWNLGDTTTLADTSNLNQVSWRYPGSVVTNAKMIVGNSKGCFDSISQPVVVVARGVNLETGYTTCNGTTLAFFNKPVEQQIATYQWNFGVEGITTDTSTRSRPVFDFRAAGIDNGITRVTLIVSYANGCTDSVTTPVEIARGLVPAFNIITPGNCSFNYQFSDSSTSRYGAINSWYWNLGDTTTLADTARGNTAVWSYPGPLATTVKLVVSNSNGCADSVTRSLVIADRPYISLHPGYYTCNGTSLTFRNELPDNNIAGYRWDFGLKNLDSDTSIAASPSFNFILSGKDSGTFQVKMWAVTTNGCLDSATTIAYVFPGFIPNFTIDTLSTNCIMNTYRFSDASTTRYGAVNSWHWDAGDTTSLADTANTSQFSWVFVNPVTAKVKLRVSNSKGCIDSVEKQLVVPMVKEQKPLLSFSFRDTLICLNDTLRLKAIIQEGSIRWIGSPDPVPSRIIQGNSATPLVFPESTTTYYAKVTGNNGCTAIDSLKVAVIPFIKLDLGSDTAVCPGSPAFRLNLTSNVPNYQWIASTGEVWNNQATPLVKPLADTRYRVVANLGHCQASDSMYVRVIPNPTVVLDKDTTICFGSKLTLHAQMQNGSSFTWSPVLTLSDGNTLAPVAAPSKTTTYAIKVNGMLNCSVSYTDSLKITVVPPVTANAGGDTLVAPGIPFQLHASGGSQYQWSPSTGLSNNNIANPIAIVSNGIDSIVYTVRVSIHTCTADDQVVVRVYKSGADILVPTAFTPNNDGKNDVARPILVGVSRLYYFTIYNRLGEAVFSTSENGKGWDGYYKGIAQPSGTYVYQLQATDYYGKIIYKKGTIVLIR